MEDDDSVWCVGSLISWSRLKCWQRSRTFLLDGCFKTSKLKSPVISICWILVSKASDIESSMDDRTTGQSLEVCRKYLWEFFYCEQKLLSKYIRYLDVQYHIYVASKFFVSHTRKCHRGYHRLCRVYEDYIHLKIVCYSKSVDQARFLSNIWYRNYKIRTQWYLIYLKYSGRCNVQLKICF